MQTIDSQPLVAQLAETSQAILKGERFRFGTVSYDVKNSVECEI